VLRDATAWNLPGWVLLMEYVPVFGAIALQFRRRGTSELG